MKKGWPSARAAVGNRTSTVSISSAGTVGVSSGEAGLSTRALGHLPALDGLRGIAVIMVMIFHWFQRSTAPRGAFLASMGRFAPIGQTGVDLFFVLSGFLITRILLNSRDDPHYFRNFYVRRALRIFPLYYGFIIVYALFLSSSYLSENRSSLWWLLLYAENIRLTFGDESLTGLTHFWTLAVEEHFYLIWPLIVYVVAPGRLWVSVMTLVALSIVSRILLLRSGYGVFHFTLCRLDGFAAGAIIACLEFGKGGLGRYRRPLLVGLVSVSVLAGFFWALTSGAGLEMVQISKYTVVALVYGGVVGLVAAGFAPGSPVAALLMLCPLRWCGMISYGLYVFHPPCYHYANMLPLNDWASLMVSFGSSGVVAWLSHRFFESRFTALKKRFASPCS